MIVRSAEQEKLCSLWCYAIPSAPCWGRMPRRVITRTFWLRRANSKALGSLFAIAMCGRCSLWSACQALNLSAVSLSPVSHFVRRPYGRSLGLKSRGFIIAHGLYRKLTQSENLFRDNSRRSPRAANRVKIKGTVTVKAKTQCAELQQAGCGHPYPCCNLKRLCPIWYTKDEGAGPMPTGEERVR